LNSPVAENVKISPFLIYFLIVGMQIGIGVLSYQRVIAKDAGYDGWMAIIAVGLTIHVILWMMYKIVETVDGDLFTAHQYLFGNIFGKMISFFFIIYFCIYAITVLRAFIEVIQIWMFQDISIFWFSFAFCLLCIYIVFGGFRTVTGIAFFGTVLPCYLAFIFSYTIPYSEFSNILPIFDHSFKELTQSYFDMSLTFTGYEIILFIYPFLKEPQKSKKWAHLGVLTTTMVYLILALITFAYFSEKQLQEMIWPTLNMWKIVEMPFVERFEYIGIANWNLIVLPNVCIAIWIASRLFKQIFHIRQKTGVILTTLVCVIVSSYLSTRIQINFLGDLLGKMSIALNYMYIPVFFIAIMIAKRVKNRG
jgi:spore germination protein AB